MSDALFDDQQQLSDEATVHKRTESEIKQFIEHNSLVWRFCAYGAIKNLQFFEAYLLVIMLEWGYNLFQIGVFSSITYALTYIFEVPSGVIADHFGKKNELLLCFIFYMFSFAFYAFGHHETWGFTILVCASVFYGLGEAFRSGTHKAMIMMWLDRHKLSKYKTFIYSRTRSFSNLGSALNAVLSVLIIIFLKNYSLVFAISVVPFVADFLMVATYPSYMNDTPDSKKSFYAITADTCSALKKVMSSKQTCKPLLSSSSFMAVFTTLKHYIQPIMVLYGGVMLAKWGAPEAKMDDYNKILIGALYAVFYLCSAVGTRNSYRLKCFFHSDKMAMDVLFSTMLLVVVAIGLCLAAGAIVVVLPLYLLLYVVMNLWKPWGVAATADLMGKERRALVLSVDSLLKTVLEFCLAPVVGYVAHAYSIQMVFLGMGALFMALNMLLLAGGWGEKPVASAGVALPEVELTATNSERPDDSVVQVAKQGNTDVV